MGYLQDKFSRAPQEPLKRSVFDRTSSHKTTFNAGDLVPFFIDEVLPGDTFKMDMSAILRSTSLIRPVMDNAYLDLYAFYVPNRLLWSSWKEFQGENPSAAWAETSDLNIPTMSVSYSTARGTLPDYFGIPVSNLAPNSPLNVSRLPFNAYALI